jgi:hypothetical protein
MPQAMATKIEQHCETIEVCYEFTLSYAARGVAGDDGDASSQVRGHLSRAVAAMRSLEDSCAELMEQEQLAPQAEKYEAFFAVMKRDAEGAIAAIELVLAQPTIGSQLIDNLNASIHLRALLADLFLVTEILAERPTQAKAAVANGTV